MFSREFIKEYTASHPESSGLKVVRFLSCIDDTDIICLGRLVENALMSDLCFRPQKLPQMPGN